MSVNWTPLPLPFAQGVDTKSDEKSIPIGKLAKLENGIFTKRGSIRKRHGYDALRSEVSESTTAFPGILSLTTRDNELLVAGDDGNLYSYSESKASWVDKGPFESLTSHIETVAKSTQQQILADRASANGIEVVAWYNLATSAVNYSIIDSETGTTLATQQAITGSELPRVIAIAGFIHIIHVNTAAHELRTLRISSADIEGSIAGTATAIATGLRTSSPTYDIKPMVSVVDGSVASAAFVFSTDASTFKIGTMTAAGSSSLSAGFACDSTSSLSIAHEPNTGRFAVGHFVSGGAALRILTSAFTSLASGNIEAISQTGNKNITCVYGTTANELGLYTAHVFWERAGATPKDNRVLYSSYTIVISNAFAVTVQRHAGLASHAFELSGRIFFNTVHDNTLQKTFFTNYFDPDDDKAHVVGKYLPGTAYGVNTYLHLPSVYSNGNDRDWTMVYASRVAAAEDTAVFSEYGIKKNTLTWESQDAARSVQVGRTTYLTGAQLWQYDGESATESGFHLFPEMATSSLSTIATTGAAMSSNGTYSYRVYYSWPNALNELERSTFSAAVSATLGGSHNSVRIKVPTLAQTLKRSPRGEVSIEIYRTENTPGDGSPYYLVTNLDPSDTSGMNCHVANDTAANYITFVDGMSDATLITKQLDYQSTDPPELDNISPEATSVIASGENRILLSGFEDPNKIIYSKIHAYGFAVSFNDALTIVCDEEGGPVTGLALMNESPVIFKERRIYVVTGQGADNLGNGAYSQPQLVTSDVGCSNQRSLVLVPGGLMFQTDKGIYLLDQRYQIQYLGADVEAYNSQTITGAHVVPSTNQVVFLTDSGKTLLYDYLFNQWSTFTNHEGTASAVWKDTYVYAQNGERVLQQSQTNYRDGSTPYKLKLETAWLKLAAMQGFQRIRNVELIGSYLSTHALRMKVAYDYENAFSNSLDWDPRTVLETTVFGDGAMFGDETPFGGGVDNVYQVRAHMPRQKCEAVKFSIEDIPGPTHGESYQLSELLLELGLKRGLNKLRDGKTIG